ncbi:hypothetical protein KIN20_033800 [Parelaphostrongylus tenuis]|uniref:Uncharacterized protein n=1 Tax=Parelaphostrongylus tenuis TaxID=148309 RepID=A0AAD5R8X4_PARTN|nr:hypothetical protein KIN20_033800 [Parelaphostrongylus tenuis]
MRDIDPNWQPPPVFRQCIHENKCSFSPIAGHVTPWSESFSTIVRPTQNKISHLRKRFWELTEHPYTPTCTTRGEAPFTGLVNRSTNEGNGGIVQSEEDDQNKSNNKGQLGLISLIEARRNGGVNS